MIQESNHTLPLDGLTREFIVRYEDTPAPRDAVIWLHSGGMTASGMMSSGVVFDANRMDICPQGLTSYGNLPGPGAPGPVWGLPGQPDEPLLPVNMHPLGGVTRVSKFHDLNFICEIIEYIRANFTFSIERFWLAGYSKGCSLVWGCYAFNNAAGLPGLTWAQPLQDIRGYFLGDYAAPMVGTIPTVADNNGFGWNIVDGIDLSWVASVSSPTRPPGAVGVPSTVVPWASAGAGAAPIVRPTLFWHGSASHDQLTQNQGHAKSWTDSAADLLRFHRSRGWEVLLPATNAQGWHLFPPLVCSRVGSYASQAVFEAEYPGYVLATDLGKVRLRHAMRHPAPPGWPNAAGVPYISPALCEMEVVGGGHTNTTDIASPGGCANPVWDESIVATNFFRHHGLGS